MLKLSILIEFETKIKIVIVLEFNSQYIIYTHLYYEY